VFIEAATAEKKNYDVLGRIGNNTITHVRVEQQHHLIYRMDPTGAYFKVSREGGWGDCVGCRLNGHLYLISKSNHTLYKWNFDGSYT
jgi:hypothetical protein